MKALEKRMCFNGVNYDPDRNLKLHRDRLKKAKKSIDNTLPPAVEHHRQNSPTKKFMAKRAEKEHIYRENFFLAKRIFDIMEGESELMEKVNDNRHVDNHPGTMNFRNRLHEAQRIHHRNMILAERLHTIKPHYKTADLTIVRPIRVKSPTRGGTGEYASGPNSPRSTTTKSNKKKTKFMKELELAFLQQQEQQDQTQGQGGNKKGGNRSVNQSPHYMDMDDGRGGVNEGNLFVVDFTSNGNTPFASPRVDPSKPGYNNSNGGNNNNNNNNNASTTPRSNILLEYTKVQDNRVLDIAVLKEPFRDRYIIFGKDIENGQRYELSLSSEDVSNILDGDILVTSVDNVEVWMALLHKIKLSKCDFFSKLPFTRDEVDFVTRGNPLAMIESQDDDIDAQRRDNVAMGEEEEGEFQYQEGTEFEAQEPMVPMMVLEVVQYEAQVPVGGVEDEYQYEEQQPTAPVTVLDEVYYEAKTQFVQGGASKAPPAGGGDGDDIYGNASFDGADSVDEGNKGIVVAEKDLDKERAFTPSAPNRPGRTSEGPRKQNSQRQLKEKVQEKEEAKLVPSDMIAGMAEGEKDATFAATPAATTTTTAAANPPPTQSLTASLSASLVASVVTSASRAISEDEQQRLALALAQVEEEKKRKEREREDALQGAAYSGSRPRTNPRSVSRPTTSPRSGSAVGRERPTSKGATASVSPRENEKEKEKEKEKDVTNNKPVANLNKQPQPPSSTATSANAPVAATATPRKPSAPAPSSSSNTSNAAGSGATPRKASYKPAPSGSVSASQSKGNSNAPTPVPSAPSADPTVAGSNKPVTVPITVSATTKGTSGAASTAATPMASSSGSGKGKGNTAPPLTNSVKNAISNIVRDDLLQATTAAVATKGTTNAGNKPAPSSGASANANAATTAKGKEKEKEKEVVAAKKTATAASSTTTTKGDQESVKDKEAEVKKNDTKPAVKEQPDKEKEKVDLVRQASLKEMASSVVDQALVDVLQKLKLSSTSSTPSVIVAPVAKTAASASVSAAGSIVIATPASVSQQPSVEVAPSADISSTKQATIVSTQNQKDPVSQPPVKKEGVSSGTTANQKTPTAAPSEAVKKEGLSNTTPSVSAPLSVVVPPSASGSVSKQPSVEAAPAGATSQNQKTPVKKEGSVAAASSIAYSDKFENSQVTAGGAEDSQLYGSGSFENI